MRTRLAVAAGGLLWLTGCTTGGGGDASGVVSPPAETVVEPDAGLPSSAYSDPDAGGADAYDAAVTDLHARAGSEAGWQVAAVPVLNEGGGIQTWWLHPCDPQSDADRDVTRTLYQGSDVVGIPGYFDVDDLTVPCAAPSATIDVDGRTVTMDVDVIPADGNRWLTAEPVEQVTATDTLSGQTWDIGPGGGYTRPEGGCVDGTVVLASLWSARDLSILIDTCAGTVAALPPEARELLDEVTDAVDEDDQVPFEADELDRLSDLLIDAGWVRDDVEFRDREGQVSTEPMWTSPCVAGPDGTGQVTRLDWFGWLLTFVTRSCEVP